MWSAAEPEGDEPNAAPGPFRYDRAVVSSQAAPGHRPRPGAGYACAGAKVAVVSRNESDCKETERHLRDFGGDAIGFAADMGRLEDLALIVERTVGEFGGIDVLVNNAGTNGRQPVGSFTVEEWQRIFDINVKGPVFLLEEALPHLKKSRHGGVLNILSIAGFLNSQKSPVYGSSQGGPFRAHTGLRGRAGAVRNPGKRARPGALRHRADPRRERSAGGG